MEVTLRKRANRKKAVNFKSQCSYQNAMLLIKFHAGGNFCLPFELRFMAFSQEKLPKNLENKSLTTTKIDYFAQFRIFSDISGPRQSRISLLIYLYFSLANCKSKNNTVVQAHTCAKVKLQTRNFSGTI